MCPSSSNIYGMKLNEGDFSVDSVITHFGDNPHQEIVIINWKQWKMLSYLHMSHLTLFRMGATSFSLETFTNVSLSPKNLLPPGVKFQGHT